MKRLHRILLLILAICCISIPAFADDPGQDLPASFEEGAVRDLPVSAGPLRINMSYIVKGNYLAGNPLFYVYLESDDAHYFIKLNYNPDTEVSTAKLENPIVGDYKITYWSPLPDNDEMSEIMAKDIDTIPSRNTFNQVRDTLRIYAGGALFLCKSQPTSLHIGNTATTLNLKSEVGYDSFIPANYIDVADIDTVAESFDLMLYTSDAYSTQGTMIDKVSTSGGTNAGKGQTKYFRDIICPAPGHYYFLIKEKVHADYMKSDKSSLMDAYVDYNGDRLCVNRISITKGGKTRTIEVHLTGENTLNIKVTDPELSGGRYYIYGSFSTTFPDEKPEDGSYTGTLTPMSKSGSNAYTISVTPPFEEWGSYVIVKKVNGRIDRGCTVNLPYHCMRDNGMVSTVWRMRPRAYFLNRYAKPKISNTAFTSLKGGVKQFTVKWKKMSAPISGYELEYSTSKKFDKLVNKKKFVSLNNTSFSNKNTKKNTTYYFRIRTFRKISPKVKIYSDWSKVESVKTS